MASGIDWFRWHHGSVTDPKFQLIARKAGARFGDVITVWAYLLEAASAEIERGMYGNVDMEAIDCMLGADDGTAARIIEAMDERGLIDGGRIANWHKRQPKREREHDSSTDRVRAFRDRQRHETPETDGRDDETPCNATKRQETPREEKRREVNPPTPRKRGDDVPAGFDEFWSAYPRKVSKPQALKAWRKLSPDTQALQAILAGIERDRRSEQWLRDGGQFIPHPATWLNGRRWEDEQATLPIIDSPAVYVRPAWMAGVQA